MRGSRVLLIVGAILIVGALAVGAIFIIRGRSQPAKPAGTEEVTPTPTEVPQIQIVVAAQDIPRGIEITEQMTRGDAPAVILKDWPEGEVPDGAITRVEDVIGRTTRVDLIRELPILASMLVEEQAGSSAALQIPEGSVAYAVPVQRYSSVAWALQPGDYVDMIISLLLVDLDEEFQTIQPNQGNCLSPSEDPACVGMGGAMGRLEVMPNGWLVNLRPNESQRPRLVTQLTIQNALVLRVGDWPIEGEQPAFPTPEPTPVPEEGVGEGEEGAAQQQPKASPAPLIAPLTLAVSRQDAMVLDYAQLMGAHVTFVLRRTGDEGRDTTESVTLQYMLDRFNIEMPPKLPYGVEPRITALETINRAQATAYQEPVSSEPQE